MQQKHWTGLDVRLQYCGANQGFPAGAIRPSFSVPYWLGAIRSRGRSKSAPARHSRVCGTLRVSQQTTCNELEGFGLLRIPVIATQWLGYAVSSIHALHNEWGDNGEVTAILERQGRLNKYLSRGNLINLLRLRRVMFQLARVVNPT
jgi:hypothetical protein